MAQDAASYYRGMIGGFTDAIRISDFKANVAIVFVGIMMGPVLAFRDKFPPYLPLALILAPFLVIYVCLLICLYPRYPRRGNVHFIIKRNADPALFQMPPDEAYELDQQQTFCAILSQILYWKTLMLKISYFACLATVAVIALMIAMAHL